MPTVSIPGHAKIMTFVVATMLFAMLNNMVQLKLMIRLEIESIIVVSLQCPHIGPILRFVENLVLQKCSKCHLTSLSNKFSD